MRSHTPPKQFGWTGSQWRAVAVLACGVLLIGGCGGGGTAPLEADLREPGQVTPAGRLQPSDLSYAGAFRVPATSTYEAMGAIAGTCSISFRADGDPASTDGFPGSLFLSNGATVAEIAIPAPLASTNVEALPVAREIQSRNGIISGVSTGANDRFGAVAYVPARGGQSSPKLYWSTYEYYNTDGTDYSSVGWADVNLASPNSKGQWRVGPAAGSNYDSPYHGQKYGEYIIPIDQAWANQYTGGRSLLVGRQREAGAFGGSMGPVLTAIGPWLDGNPPAPGASLSAVPLMYFNSQQGHVGSDTTWMEWRINGDPHYEYFSAGDQWHGGAWVERNGKRALIMVGRHGTFSNSPAQPTYGSSGSHGAVNSTTPPFCYGTGGVECAYGIAVTGNKGYHNGPYRPRLVFIDTGHLAEVAQSKRSPRAVQAYAAKDPLRDGDWPWSDSDNFNDVCGAAYDSNSGLLYVAQTNGYRPGGGHSTPWPVIHAYRVN